MIDQIEIANRLAKCFSSVVHDVMMEKGYRNFTLPPDIKPTKLVNTESAIRKAIRAGMDPQEAYLKYGVF